MRIATAVRMAYPRLKSPVYPVNRKFSILFDLLNGPKVRNKISIAIRKSVYSASYFRYSRVFK
jgi:hypothetical protein